MAEAPVIAATGLSKSYRIWTDPSQRLVGPVMAEAANWIPGSLGAALRRKAHHGYRDFFALQDVSFEVRRGEAVGIVGRNGAGKSTLLQMIAGTLQPTAGEIAVRGRVAALLELGAGFNPEFTGRENVFLSGAVLGLSKAEMEARYDDVLAFADIGEFIEQPVKTYSSGMMMRLAFAVNTCVDPEVLIVDEALSVGDAPFQAKCFRRLRQLIDNGVSLLFVSHDLGTVRTVCSRALWLKSGRTEMWGEATQVARAYERFCWQEQGVVLDETAAPAEPERGAPGISDSSRGDAVAAVATENPAARAILMPPGLTAENAGFDERRARSRYGTGRATIDNVLLTRQDGEWADTFEYGEEVTIWAVVTVRQPIASECIVSFLLRDLRGHSVLATQDVSRPTRLDAPAGRRLVVRTTLPLPLHHQKYVLHVAIFGFKDGSARPNGVYDFGNAIVWDVVDEAAFLEVRPNPVMPLSGPVHFDRPVEMLPLDSLS